MNSLKVESLRVRLKSGSVIYIRANADNLLDLFKQAYAHPLALGDYIEVDGDVNGVAFPIAVRLKVADVEAVDVVSNQTLKFN